MNPHFLETDWLNPRKCCVAGCLNTTETTGKSLLFHNFPLKASDRVKWINVLNLDQNIEYQKAIICSEHFTPNDYKRTCNPDLQATLSLDAVPSLHLHIPGDDSTITETNFKEIQLQSDLSITLNNEHKKLIKQQEALTQKLTSYEAKILKRKGQIDRLKRILKKKKNQNQSENQLLSKVLSYAQRQILIGTKKKVFWSDDDLARAFTLRHIGSKECYLYLKNTLNFPLPSLSCVQKWAVEHS